MSDKLPGNMVIDASLFSYKHRWVAMFTLLLANFMTFLDVNIVNVALPSLQKTFSVDETSIQWIVTTYLLVYALALLPLGRFGDMIGRKFLFIAGIIFFTVTSLLCGAANSIDMLIISRALQGFSAAMITPQVMAIAQAMFAPKERAKPFSLFGLVAGLAAIAGPLVSGILIKLNLFDFGWRSIFYINIPIGILLPIIAFLRLPPSEKRMGSGVQNDWFGIVLLASALCSLIYPLIEGRSYGWPTWCFILMAAFIPLCGAFIFYSNRQSKKGKRILLPFYLMQNRDYILGTVSVMAFYSALQGFFFIFVFFLQQGLNFTPFLTGLATSAFPIGILVATQITVRIQNLMFKILFGVFLALFASITMWILTAHMQGQLTIERLIFPLFINGIGSGIIIASLFQTVMRTVPLKDAGAGAGALQTMQQIGAAFGVAIVSQIFFSNILHHNGVVSIDTYVASFQYTIIYYILAYFLVAIATFGMKFEAPQNVVVPQRS
jgi:EmrB/QacA subfamily drug resistance transporter